MDLHGWVDAYLDHLRVERALSPRSVEAYARDLAKLCAHAEESGAGSTEQFDGTLVDTYLVSLGKAGLRARSAVRHLSAVRGFGRFLVRERELPSDPCVLVERPRIGRRLPKVLSIEEIERILDAPDREGFRRPARPGDDPDHVRGGPAGERARRAQDRRHRSQEGRRLRPRQGRQAAPRSLGEPALEALDAYLALRAEHPRAAGTPALFLRRGAAR